MSEPGHAVNRGIPWIPPFLTALVASGFLFLGDPLWLLAAANVAFLGAIGMPAIAAWWLRKKDPPESPFRLGRGAVVAGGIWAIAAMFTFRLAGPRMLLAGTTFAYCGTLLHLWRKMAGHRKMGLPPVTPALQLKMSGTMLLLLALNTAGYWIASHRNPAQPVIAEALVMGMALLSVVIGLLLPGTIVFSFHELQEEAGRAARGLEEAEKGFAKEREILLRRNEELRLQLSQQTGQALLESQQRLHEVHFALDEHALVDITDQTGKLLYLNDKFCHVSKYPREELLGGSHRLINSGFHSKAFFERLWQTISRGDVWKGEIRNRARDASYYWVDTTIVPCLDQRGEPYQYIAIRTDVTERRKAEAQLASARDAALEAARSKSQFLANMSHEIRTPMNGVIGMAGLLSETRLDRDQRDYVETIRQSGDLLLTIINDILDFSKIEAGKLTFELLDFNLREVVEDTMEMLAETAQAKGLELLALVNADVFPYLRGDAGRLRQVLTNLLNNAIKFTGKGEVLLRVSQLADSTLRFEVTDTGIGISRTAQESLFQPFNQADGSTTRKYGGTGLGLAIARQLVTLMGGEIGVESEPDKGSTFWFTTRLEPQQLTPAMELPHLAGLHVLIADDNATSHRILQLQLDNLRIRSEAVAGGREALDSLKRQAAKGDPYDLAILDTHLPDMDGALLAAAIKSDPLLRQTRLVILGALGSSVNEQRRKEIGVEGCLLKPIKQSKLYDCLATVMKRGPAAKAPPCVAVPLEAPRHTARILLAEDNMINQKVALRQLQKLGYHADSVADGNEVLEAIQRIPYDIILMDCQMPELDGYETTRRIRRKEKRPIHIIAMTAHAMEGDRQKCLDAGMSDYLTKPVRTADLHAALGRWKPESGEECPVDFRLLREASNGDLETMRDLVRMYLEQADDIMSRLDGALKSGAALEVNRLAHKLAGASAICGMVALVPLLNELEQLGLSNQLAAAHPIQQSAVTALRRIKRFLGSYLPSSVASSGEL
ncbi:MAG: response regulator [Verrucomicrobiota bacterium]